MIRPSLDKLIEQIREDQRHGLLDPFILEAALRAAYELGENSSRSHWYDTIDDDEEYQEQCYSGMNIATHFKKKGIKNEQS